MTYNNSFSGPMNGFGPNFFQGHPPLVQWNGFSQHVGYHHPPLFPHQFLPPSINSFVPWNAGPSNYYHQRPYQNYHHKPYNNKSQNENKEVKKKQKKKEKRKRRQEKKRKQAEEDAKQLEAKLQILDLQDPAAPPPYEGKGKGKGKAVESNPAAEDEGPVGDEDSEDGMAEGSDDDDDDSDAVQDNSTIQVEKERALMYYGDQQRLCEYYIPRGDSAPVMCVRHGVRCEYFADPYKSLRNAPVRRPRSTPPM